MYKVGLVMIGVMLGVGCFWLDGSAVIDRDSRIRSVAKEYCTKYKHCARHDPSPSSCESEAEHLIAVRRSLIAKEEESSASGQDTGELKVAIKRLDRALSHKSNLELSYLFSLR